MKYRSKDKNQSRLFSSNILEFFTKTHPLLIFSIYVPLCISLLWYSFEYLNPSTLSIVLYYLFGIITWTFFEYILHRYIFHFEGKLDWQKRMHYLIHGIHHDFPRDEKRLAMPPLPSIIIALSFYLLFRFIFKEMVFSFFSGFLSGYLLYAFIHYATHAIRPPKNRLRFLWKYHNQHHFKYPDKAYGVSSPLWDFVFGTLPPSSAHKESEKSVIVLKIND